MFKFSGTHKAVSRGACLQPESWYSLSGS